MQVDFGYSLRVPRTAIASSLPYAHRYKCWHGYVHLEQTFGKHAGHGVVASKVSESGMFFCFVQRLLGSVHEPRDFESSAHGHSSLY